MLKYYLFCFVPVFLPSLVSTPLKNFFILPVLFFSICYVVCNKKIDFFSFCLFVCFFVLLVFLPSLSSIFVGIEPSQSNINEILKLLTYLFYGLSIFFIKQKISLDQLSKLLITFVLLNSLLVLVIFIDDSFAKVVFFLYHVESDAEEFMQYLFARPSGAFGNPNALGIALCLCALFFLVLNKKIFTVITLTMMLLTQSRTAFFCFIICFFIHLIVRKHLLSILCILIFSLYLIVYLAANENIFFSALYTRFSDINLAGRDSLWINLFESDFIAKSYFGLFIIPEGISFIDNEYLNLYVRYGVVSFLFFFVLLIFIFIKYMPNSTSDYSSDTNVISVRNRVCFIVLYSLIVIVLSSFTASITTMLKLFLFYLFFYFSLTKVCYDKDEI